MSEEIILEKNKSADLKKIVNEIEVIKKESSKKNKTKEKKIKKLPSVNLMKTKTIRFIKEKRQNLLKEVKKNNKNYKFVIENISKMRDETRLFKSLINKKPSDIKDLYFKYFWHIHGLKKNEK